MTATPLEDGLRVSGPLLDRYDEILTPEALGFLELLHRELAVRRDEECDRRFARGQELAHGSELGFLTATRAVRDDSSWRVAPAAPGLEDRRCEITGPPDRRMAVHALRSGAQVWMADFEDATSPTWENVINGQLTLLDAVNGRLAADGPATIVVRPRGWHLSERHLTFCGKPATAALVDFGLYMFHCSHRQIERGYGPYFYLPKLQSHHEARLWNDVFTVAQEALGIPYGTIRATVLIETLPAAFEMEEILYELRDHVAGLNAGRWDYIFSAIKTFPHDPGRVLPDRSAVTMTVPFMRAYTELLVHTCHKRGAYAIGGMAAFIPSKEPAENAAVLEKVRADKTREANDGFDGSWVAHPGLVETCREAFDAVLGGASNQLDRLREDVAVDAAQLIAIDQTPGTVTPAGVAGNVAVALRYLEAWLRGSGAVAIFGLMEDAATVEIARAQLWQWIHHRTVMDGGETVTPQHVQALIDAETAALLRELPEDNRVEAARSILVALVLDERLGNFFTPHAYRRHLIGGH